MITNKPSSLIYNVNDSSVETDDEIHGPREECENAHSLGIAVVTRSNHQIDGELAKTHLNGAITNKFSSPIYDVNDSSVKTNDDIHGPREECEHAHSLGIVITTRSDHSVDYGLAKSH